MQLSESNEVLRETYKPGDFIFFEGDIDFDLYIVEKGEVQIFTKAKDGRRINIMSVGPGDSFGEFAALDRKPRSASAQALSDTVVFKISEQGYEQLLRELPLWAATMLRSFSSRIRRMNGFLSQMTETERP